MLRFGMVALLLLSTPAWAQDSAVEGEVAALWEFHQELQGAMSERGPAAIPEFYAPDAVIMPAEAGRLDREAFMDVIREFGGLPGASARFEPEEYIVSEGGGMAYEVGSYELAYGESGLRQVEQGDYIAVFQKRDGRWWVVLEVHSPNPEPEQP